MKLLQHRNIFMLARASKWQGITKSLRHASTAKSLVFMGTEKVNPFSTKVETGSTDFGENGQFNVIFF
jgi:hypothetical protein